MKLEEKCGKCNTDNIIVENSLFFAEEKKIIKVLCSYCREQLLVAETDGWFYVQTKAQYEFELKIDKQKEILKFLQSR